jgi:hypothetical protein
MTFYAPSSKSSIFFKPQLSPIALSSSSFRLALNHILLALSNLQGLVLHLSPNVGRHYSQPPMGDYRYESRPEVTVSYAPSKDPLVHGIAVFEFLNSPISVTFKYKCSHIPSISTDATAKTQVTIPSVPIRIPSNFT